MAEHVIKPAIKGLFLNDWGLSRCHVMILMQLSFVGMGVFLDDNAMLVIVAPLYVLMVNAMGFSLVWFGVLHTITCQIAYITPPLGYNLFLMKAMAPKDFPLKDIYASIIPFAALMFLPIVLLMVFPEIALWLPNKFMVKYTLP